MADCWETDEMEEDSDVGDLQVCVKNTFLEVVESPGARRRHMSVPSEARLACRDTSAIKNLTDCGHAKGAIGPGARPTLAAGKSHKAYKDRPPPGMPLPQMSQSDAQQYTNHCKALAGATRAALVTCGYVLAAEVTEGTLGWTVVAHIGAQDHQRRDELLGVTREAILAAARLSDPVCVLGGKACPFSATPMGFTARLGAMSRRQPGGCWNMLDQGCCKYGSRCRWQHPIAKKTLSVVVKVVDL